MANPPYARSAHVGPRRVLSARGDQRPADADGPPRRQRRVVPSRQGCAPRLPWEQAPS